MRKVLDNGIVQITLDNQRWYWHPDLDIYVPSATWILNYYPKGEGFKRWLASKVDTWEESQELVNAAADRGKAVHRGFEMLMTGQTIAYDEIVDERPLKIEEYRYILSGVGWLKRYKPLVLSVEETVWGLDDLYAGTVDLIVQIDKGLTVKDGRGRWNEKAKPTGELETWLIDLKTSAAIYPTHELQVAAYAHAPAIAKNIDRVGILKLGDIRRKDGYEFKEVYDIDDKFEVFLATRHIWEHENPKAKPRVIEIPEKITLWNMYKEDEDGSKEEHEAQDSEGSEGEDNVGDQISIF